MARTFQSRRTLTAVSEINLTNMIDLGFTLLIIFMISTPLIEREAGLPVQVPVASPQPAPEEEYLDITVDVQGRIIAAGRVVDAATLRGLLDAEAARPRPRIINVRADYRLQYQQVVTVLDLVKQAGLSRLSLETRSP